VPPRSRGCLLAELIDTFYRQPTEAAEAGEDCIRHPLMRGWRVVEEVSVGTDDYMLLRRIQPSKVTGAGLDSLTPREREALHHASLGPSNKEIAHRMKVSASTVGVLLWRAARKLGAIDREDLLRRVAQYKSSELKPGQDR
jgi:DNA-binding CsgD family transcriptional regulator